MPRTRHDGKRIDPDERMYLVGTMRDAPTRRPTPAIQPSRADTASFVVDAGGAPGAPGSTVHRPRVVGLLDDAARQRLTLVIAPRGYGKTTALAHWAQAERRSVVRWLTIRPEHDDPRLLAHDLARTILGSTGTSAHAGGSAVLAPDDLTSVATSVADRHELPPITLVLDDLHRITRADELEELAALIDRAPSTFHVIASTQVEPPLYFYRLRFSEPVVEIRQEHLAFTSQEAYELVRTLTGRSLPETDVDSLVARTDGWAVGLQLAARSLRDDAMATSVDDVMERDDNLVTAYFREHLLRRTSATMHRFLLQTSVLNRMTGALCDHVMRSHGGQTMLEELDRTSTFITRLDKRRLWFRYQPQLRRVLRAELHDTDPTLERDLLARAARWHLERDDVDTGVDYLLEAGSWDAVFDATSRHGHALMLSGRASELAQWFGQVPDDARRTRAEFMLLEAAALTFTAGPRGTTETLDVIERAAEAGGGTRVVADMVRAHWALSQGLSAEALRSVSRVFERVGDVLPDELPNVLGITATCTDVIAAARLAQGLACLYEGRYAEARMALTTTTAASDGMWQLLTMGALALIDAWAGDLTAARRRANRTLAMADELGMGRWTNTTALLALAHVARERGDLVEAAVLLHDATRPTDHRIEVVPEVLGTVESAALDLANGDPASGLERLADRGATERLAMPPVVLAKAAAVEVCLLIACGEPERARDVLDRCTGDVLTSDLAAAAVRLEVESGDLAAARVALGRMPATPAPRALLERRLWCAILDWIEDRQGASLAGLADVLEEAEREHHLGVFVPAGARLLAPARSLLRTEPSPFLRAVVESVSGQASSRQRTTRVLVEQLTDREYEVLSLLPTRLSSAEIADRLGISLNTIKTHLKHVYRKLGVSGRNDAIATSERLHLL